VSRFGDDVIVNMSLWRDLEAPGEVIRLPGGQLPRKVKIPASARPGHFRAKWPKVPAFETCNMLYFALDMYSSAPIKDMGRRGRSAVDE
jgi:hypothetical protein